MAKNKNCDCGHSKTEYMLTQKNTLVLDILLFHDRIVSLQEGTGECMKCHCPEYTPPSRFNPRCGMNYALLTIKNDNPEERCARCGRLLINHEKTDHPFQYTKIPL